MMSRTAIQPLKILAAVAAAFLVWGLLLAYSASPAQAAIITVNSTADDADPNDGECTLREAITAANTNTASGTATGECANGSGDDEIHFALPGTAPWTVDLTTALPDLSTNIDILGPGADQLTVRRSATAATNFRIFTVTGDTTVVTISGMTISNGNPSGDGGGIDNDGQGTLTVTNSTISGNTARWGGGIANTGHGTLTVTGSTISGNTAAVGDGGGIYIDTGEGTVTVTGSTISGNTAAVGDGGGIANGDEGALTVTGSTISDNDAGRDGGGIISDHNSNLTVTGSTISDNDAGGSSASGGEGGGILYDNSDDANLRVTDSTISGNTAAASSDATQGGEGGGIWSDTDLANNSTTITNSTISGNTAAGSGASGAVGGGVYNSDGLTVIEFSTITNNTAPAGRGSGVASFGDFSTLTEVLSSIISANTNTDVDFVNGTINSFLSGGFNLIGDGNATGDFNLSTDRIEVADPGLDPLDSYGGPTNTHRLQSDSPALDAGPPTDGETIACPPPETDQRGVQRPQDGDGDSTAVCDIGSFELEPPETPAPEYELGGGDNFYHENECPPDGDEVVFGRGGHDRLRLDECGDPNTADSPEDGFPETPDTDSDADVGNGNSGNDVIRVDDGDIQDTANGGNGSNDRCVGDLDIGESAQSVDDAPVGPGGGTGAEEDVGDNLTESCETIVWREGIAFYTQS